MYAATLTQSLPFAEYFAPKMVHSYARAFQVHQRPLKTAPVHVFFMTNLPYLVYLPLVAMPVDIVAHTLQFFWGESMFFFEGGIYFPYYMALHWFVLALAYCAIYVRFIPALWPSYFRFFRKVLAVNDVEYRRTLCTKRTPITRVLHFAAFLSLLALSIHVLSESYCVALVKRAAVALVYVLVFFGITASMGMGFGRLFVGLDCGGKK